MQWLKRVVPKLLVVAAAAVALATAFSDHDSDYGVVTLPTGGTVHLPQGTVKVFANEGPQQSAHKLAAPLVFDVTPVAGGAAVSDVATGKEGSSLSQTERSEEIGSAGSVAKLEVPSEGDYLVSGSFGDSLVELTFGTDGFTAVIDKWKVWGGLLAGAFLFTLIPVPRSGSSEDEISSTASAPRQFTPYNG